MAGVASYSRASSRESARLGSPHSRTSSRAGSARSRADTGGLRLLSTTPSTLRHNTSDHEEDESPESAELAAALRLLQPSAQRLSSVEAQRVLAVLDLLILKVEYWFFGSAA